ncbi:MAG: 30S ribosomal protein S17e [Thermoplasmata archaeon]|nr:MAG: 30S ribosomal protein S17e [Thermoplasmata archaeon]
MGNVRPMYIKRVALELVQRFPDIFSDDFQSNKKFVEQYTSIKSKMVRNRIAGYIAKIMEKPEAKENEEES